MLLVYKNIIKLTKDDKNKFIIALMDNCQVINVPFSTVYTSDDFITSRQNLYAYLKSNYNNGNELVYDIRENDTYDILISKINECGLLNKYKNAISNYDLTEHQMCRIMKALITLNK